MNTTRLRPCGALSAAADAARRTIHKTIAAVGDDIERFRFNRAVARIRELTNALEALSLDEAGAPEVMREGLETLTQLLGPMMPHLGEELWQALGHEKLLADEPWPKADAELAREDTVTLAVQVNGKLRGTVDLPRDADQRAAESAALALAAVQKALEGRAPRRTIVVPNRIVNVVV